MKIKRIIIVSLVGCLILVGLYFVFFDNVQNEIVYSWRGISIKRIDKDAKTNFYYIDKNNETRLNVTAEYSGVNDGFNGYLEFHKDGSVILLINEGYFYIKTKNSKFQLTRWSEYPYYSQRRQHFLQKRDSIICDSICLINRCTPYEKETNEKLKSGVKTCYKYNVNKELRW